jgi:hypothetical protein
VSLETRLRPSPSTEHQPNADSSATLALPSPPARTAKERRRHTNSSTPTTMAPPSRTHVPDPDSTRRLLATEAYQFDTTADTDVPAARSQVAPAPRSPLAHARTPPLALALFSLLSSQAPHVARDLDEEDTSRARSLPPFRARARHLPPTDDESRVGDVLPCPLPSYIAPQKTPRSHITPSKKTPGVRFLFQ